MEGRFAVASCFERRMRVGDVAEKRRERGEGYC